MRGILTIAGKDIRALFLSPLFYIIAALCSLPWAILFMMSLGKFVDESMMAGMNPGGGPDAGPNIHYQVFWGHIYLVNFILMLAVAAITMRLFSEEKKTRTFDLLLTSPVTSTQIVLGKYLAGVVVAWALVGLSAIFPLSVVFFGKFDVLMLIAAYAGLMLLVAGYVSIGMFASSLTDSSVLAVIMALIFTIGVWFIGSGIESADSPTMSAVFEHMFVGTHFVNFLKGSVSISSVVFFASLIFFWVFLTQRVVESLRWR